MNKTRLIPIFFALAGFAFLCWLLIEEGFDSIFKVLTLVGLNFFWIIIYRVIPITLDAWGWQNLFQKINRPAFLEFIKTRWLAEAINTLLPVAQVGGHFLRARILGKRHNIVEEASATVVVDFTIGLITQILFVIIGIILLLRVSVQQIATSLLFLGLGISLLAVYGFFSSQKAGIFGFTGNVVQRFVNNKKIVHLTNNAERLDQRIVEVYGRKDRLPACFLLRLAGWLTRCGENWLFFYFAGIPITVEEALILESLSTALRSAAFFIPSGLGVQDGGLLLVGSLLGLQSPGVLALALAKRFRELIVGLPGIFWWIMAESRFLKNH